MADVYAVLKSLIPEKYRKEMVLLRPTSSEDPKDVDFVVSSEIYRKILKHIAKNHNLLEVDVDFHHRGILIDRGGVKIKLDVQLDFQGWNGVVLIPYATFRHNSIFNKEFGFRIPVENLLCASLFLHMVFDKQRCIDPYLEYIRRCPSTFYEYLPGFFSPKIVRKIFNGEKCNNSLLTLIKLIYILELLFIHPIATLKAIIFLKRIRKLLGIPVIEKIRYGEGVEGKNSK